MSKVEDEVDSLKLVWNAYKYWTENDLVSFGFDLEEDCARLIDRSGKYIGLKALKTIEEIAMKMAKYLIDIVNSESSKFSLASKLNSSFILIHAMRISNILIGNELKSVGTTDGSINIIDYDYHEFVQKWVFKARSLICDLYLKVWDASANAGDGYSERNYITHEETYSLDNEERSQMFSLPGDLFKEFAARRTALTEVYPIKIYVK